MPPKDESCWAWTVNRRAVGWRPKLKITRQTLKQVMAYRPPGLDAMNMWWDVRIIFHWRRNRHIWHHWRGPVPLPVGVTRRADGALIDRRNEPVYVDPWADR